MESGKETPIFPLNTVLFPGGVLPLRIFESRYLDMVSRCLQEDNGFVVVLIKDGEESANTTVCRVGTLVKIVNWDMLKDGLLGITVEAETRVALDQIKIGKDHLMMAKIEPLPAESAAPVLPEFSSLVELLKRILSQIDAPYNQLQPNYDDSGWVAARLTEFLPIPLLSKQKILQLDDPLSRIHALHDEMRQLKVI